MHAIWQNIVLLSILIELSNVKDDSIQLDERVKGVDDT